MSLNESIDISAQKIRASFPASFDGDAVARAQTLFYKRLALLAHRFYGGKLQTAPRCGLPHPSWLGVWYTPGVSSVSTAIRDSFGTGEDESFSLSGRGNTVAIVSDSTRVLGDGDCSPPGGMGVMEGKAYLMKYLGGVDAVPLCMDSRGRDGIHDPGRIVDFVRMVQHSFGAVNLEDISQPNCFRVLDELRDSCDIPVWHDDAQGTACVTLAGLLNALELAGKRLPDVRIVLFGAGAANTTIARLIMAGGGDPGKIALFDLHGGLHAGRRDLESDASAYRQWELAASTNPGRLETPEEAMKGADVVIALSAPGPDVIKRPWVRSMADRAIVFACANPVPEIWPYAAKEEGAFIVATGRGDFPNQVNNSVCFPGILKGALLVRARGITDGMAIRCAHSLADFAKRRGISPDSIMPSMEETGVFATEAADVAEQAAAEGVARNPLPRGDVYARALADIEASRAMFRSLEDAGFIRQPPASMVQEALDWAIGQIRDK
ncbi:MAG: NADP-dependent malic enzyme [Spirochaetes bacterium]|nr:NADP-dependent malic enzyme [Spirochaetota bacterium]